MYSKLWTLQNEKSISEKAIFRCSLNQKFFLDQKVVLVKRYGLTI